MKKLLLLGIILILSSCDVKDKNGNALLIDDGSGRLVDNPAYVSEEDEAKAERIEKYKEISDDGYDETATASLETRENFIKIFKPKAGGKDMKLSGKDKTTITFTSAFNTASTSEQFENLNYFNKLKDLGFKKVIISNGDKAVYTKVLD